MFFTKSGKKKTPRIEMNSRNLKKRSKRCLKIDRKMGMKLAQLQRNHTIFWGSEALHENQDLLLTCFSFLFNILGRKYRSKIKPCYSTLSGPHRASYGVWRDVIWIKVKLSVRSTRLDGSQHPDIVSNNRV